MAIDKRQMRSIIKRNGHLIQTGEESIEELREALIHLRRHTLMTCQRIHLGTPIEMLLPDITVLMARHTRSTNAKTQTAVIRKERL